MLGISQNKNDDVERSLQALAEASPQHASPAVERNLLIRFRKRRAHKRLQTYVATLAASLALTTALYLSPWHARTKGRSVSPPEKDQTSGFIVLPYAQSGVPLEQAVIVRVHVSASELGTIGVPYPPARPGKSVRADLLIGQDGVVRAVRLVE